jgi:hypothetical protein
VKRNLSLRTKNGKNSILIKRYQEGILPRLTDALNKVRPKLTFSLSDISLTNLTENPLSTNNEHHFNHNIDNVNSFILFSFLIIIFRS